MPTHNSSLITKKDDFLSKEEFESIYPNTQEVMKLLRSSIMTKKAKLGLLTISIAIAVVSLFGYVFL